MREVEQAAPSLGEHSKYQEECDSARLLMFETLIEVLVATCTDGRLAWVTSRIRWHLYLKKYYSSFQRMTRECDLA